MAVNQFWEKPGDMLYDWRSRPMDGLMPMISTKEDDDPDSAARWSPEKGWRWEWEEA